MAGAAKTPAIPPRLRRLQALDRRLGPYLCRWWPRATREPAGSHAPIPAEAVRRLLVIRPGGLGDAILLWPMLRALAAHFAGARIEVLAERRNAAAFAIGAAPFDVLRYDDGPLAALRRLRGRDYDLVIDTEQYHHLSAVFADALRPRWLCGFDTLGRARFHTHPVAHSEDDYEALSFLRLAAAVCGTVPAFDADAPFLFPAEAERDWAQTALAPAADRPMVAVMPGAGGIYRLWAPERYAAVAREFDARGMFVVVLGGADAAEAGRLIAAAGALDLTGRTTLPQTAAVLARARLALSADTGVLHLAYAVGTPTVGLFGPGLHRKWAPPGHAHRVVRKGLACSPCIRLGQLPDCPYNIACMREITVADVISAVPVLTS